MTVIAGNIYDNDWVTQRASTSYPLSSAILNKNINYSFILDAKVLIPLYLTLNSDALNIILPQFYISRILDTTEGYRLLVSFGDSLFVGHTKPIAKNYRLIDYSIQTRVLPVIITNPKYTGIQISLCIGDTFNYKAGTQTLTKDLGLFNLFCYSIYKPIYTGILSINGLVGDVTIKALEGIIITVDLATNSIIISREAYIIDPESLLFKLLLAPYVKSINGVKPDITGDIALRGSDCLTVNTASSNTLTILNPCGKPCCDSSTVDSLTAAAMSLLLFLKLTLKLSIISLANNINYMQANLATLMGGS